MNFFSLFKRNIIFLLKKKIDIDKDIFEKNIKLEELFSFYKTDKAKYLEENAKGNKLSGHGYTEFYEKHFSDFRNKEINILEIGSAYGAAASAFAKYFSKSNIYCLDINLTNFIYRSNQIYPFGIDATNIEMVNKFLKKINFSKDLVNFDIIIDDGSHILSHQLKALNIFFKLVSPGGYYVVEEYKFPEYFEHLNDTDDPPLSKIIEDIKNKKNISVKLFNEETLRFLKIENLKIFEYKGDQKISDIVFLKKL